MCIVRKPRTSYTLEEDVVALRAITAPSSGIFSGGSAGAKLQHWVEVAERVSAQGVEVTGDGLRRHVADLVKKHKKQGLEPPGGRMRWGMPWPKSDEEVQRDRLIEEYMTRLEESKKVVAPVARPPTKTAPAKKPAPALSAQPAPQRTASFRVAPTVGTMSKTPPAMLAPRAIPSSVVHTIVTKTPVSKRNQPGPVAIDDDGDDFGVSWLPDSPPSKSSTSNEAMKLHLKRQRLEMEERTQNRMLDIQAEQIKLQREQLRLQAEAMRSVAESAQAIAHAVQALQKRLA